MNHPYLPILFVLLLGVGFSALFLILSAVIGPGKKRKDIGSKHVPYECGFDPIGDTREGFDVKFSLIALLFILFDIETVFLFPWAVLFKDFLLQGLGLFMLIEMLIFIIILALGFVYVWRKGALDWNKRLWT